MDKTELIHKMRAGHQPIEAAADTMPDDALLAEAPGMPGWTRKDVLAHIEFWHRHSAAVLGGVRSGVNPYPDEGADFDINALNARVLSDNRGRPGADVREGEEASFKALVAAVEAATDGELFGSGLVPWLEGPASGVIAGDTWDHYPEHVPHLAG
jgi:hypothetical protein